MRGSVHLMLVQCCGLGFYVGSLRLGCDCPGEVFCFYEMLNDAGERKSVSCGEGRV